MNDTDFNDTDFDRLLDAVSDAFHDRPFDLLWVPPHVPEQAANDNGLMWPMVPFPDGWQASC